MPPHKVKLQICGSSYVVSTNDSAEYLTGLAERLDEDMNQVMREMPNASVTAAAVITALGYLDEAQKNAQGADNMRAQLQDYLEDAAKAKLAAEEAKREAGRLRRELAAYEQKGKRPSAMDSELDLPGARPAPKGPMIPITPPPTFGQPQQGAPVAPVQAVPEGIPGFEDAELEEEQIVIEDL